METKEKESKDHTVYSMGFSKRELDLLDKAMRASLIEDLDNIAEYVTTGSADIILQRLQEDVLEMAALLKRVTYMLCTAYDSEAEKEVNNATEGASEAETR